MQEWHLIRRWWWSLVGGSASCNGDITSPAAVGFSSFFRHFLVYFLESRDDRRLKFGIRGHGTEAGILVGFLRREEREKFQ